jgi:adenylate cyclase
VVIDLGNEPLTEAELAESSGVTVDFVRQLVAERIISGGSDGRFPRRYARRVRLWHGVHASGVGFDAIRSLRGVAEADYGDRWMPHPSPRSPRRFADFRASLGERAELFDQIWPILGLPEPAPDDHLGVDDEEAITRFLETWGDDPVVAARAARIAADAMWRFVDGWARLFTDLVIRPVQQLLWQGQTTIPQEVIETAIARGRAGLDSVFQAERWLTLRYIERFNVAQNVETADAALRGGDPTSGAFADAPPRAVVFTDVAGYTAETHDMGDERAAVIALKLREHADETARQSGGRLVKLLGDGAILMFRAPGPAFNGTRLLARSWPADMPGLHTGIGIGPVLEIDGDVYGSTVNLAARLSQAARPGQILVASLGGREAVQGEGLSPVGPLTLKGIPVPVPAMEVVTG